MRKIILWEEFPKLIAWSDRETFVPHTTGNREKYEKYREGGRKQGYD